MRKLNDLKRPSMVKRIGSLYLGIRDSDKWSLAYSQVFMVRRILFVGISFGLKQHASLQIHFFTFCNLGYIIFLGLVAPHSFAFTTQLEIINEAIFVLICYMFILFTDITSDRVLRTNLGWVLVSLVLLILVANFAVIFGASAKALFSRLKLNKQRNEYQLARRGIYINSMKLVLNSQLPIS